MNNRSSNSLVQLAAEGVILGLAADVLGVSLAPRRIQLPDGGHLNVDGFDAGPPVTVVEVYARQGVLRGAQPKKLRADALKLLALRKLLYPDARLVVVVASEEAERSFHVGWTKEAFKAFGIELCRVTLDPQLVATLSAAQARQHMNNTVGDGEQRE